jgi:hypothetical protein
MSTLAADPRRRLPVALPLAIALAWAAAVAAETSGAAASLHHDGLIEGDLPRPVALVLFLAAWQLMTAAMMLPSSLPLVRLFWATSGSRRSLAAFLGGYTAVWSIFGAAAFAGDVVLHELFHLVGPLEQPARARSSSRR